MSEVYNPESSVYERIESLGVQIRELRRKADRAQTDDDRRIIERQMDEARTMMRSLKHRLMVHR